MPIENGKWKIGGRVRAEPLLRWRRRWPRARVACGRRSSPPDRTRVWSPNGHKEGCAAWLRARTNLLYYISAGVRRRSWAIVLAPPEQWRRTRSVCPASNAHTAHERAYRARAGRKPLAPQCNDRQNRRRSRQPESTYLSCPHASSSEERGTVLTVSVPRVV